MNLGECMDLGVMSAERCREQCGDFMAAVGMPAGCWILGGSLRDRCYCRGGDLEQDPDVRGPGHTHRTGGSCNLSHRRNVAKKKKTCAAVTVV